MMDRRRVPFIYSIGDKTYYLSHVTVIKYNYRGKLLIFSN